MSDVTNKLNNNTPERLQCDVITSEYNDTPARTQSDVTNR